MKREKEKGFILIPVLLVFTVIIAMVGDFSYEIFVNTVSLKNYVISQRLSVLGSSAMDFAIEHISNYMKGLQYTDQREIILELSGFIDEEGLSLVVILSDENAKFNINSLYTHSSIDKTRAREGLRKLFHKLKVDEAIAYTISDWIDRDSDEEYPGGERFSKNRGLYSIEELLQIPGINEEIYDKLKPYVTCYTDGKVNINSASVEVLLTMDGITEAIAEAIINYRNERPFEKPEDLKNVSGISPAIYQSLQGRYTVKALVYGITIKAEQSGIKKLIHGVVNPEILRLKYYREE
ncbi:MAG: general secretion pathway protein GspK [Thermodesulfovibrionales bacterium]|nr:general secretion pathway protein GspK [Thermodesulfovibrionales bacterium]